MNYLIQWSESNPNSLQSMNSAPQKQNFLDKIRARVSDNLVPLQTADRVVALGLALRNIKIERKRMRMRIYVSDHWENFETL